MRPGVWTGAGAVEGLQVWGAGRPGFRWGWWTLKQGLGGGETPVCQAEHPTLTLRGWTCPPPSPHSSLGFLVWESGPEPDAALNQGPLAPRSRLNAAGSACMRVCVRE